MVEVDGLVISMDEGLIVLDGNSVESACVGVLEVGCR